jgi:ABC-type sugar transport system ATPase subunit
MAIGSKRGRCTSMEGEPKTSYVPGVLDQDPSGWPVEGDGDGRAGSEKAGAVVCTGLWRSFGGQIALRGVDLVAAAGRIHALVGQNGAGKSTVIGVLSGRVAPERGVVLVNGAPLRFGDPRASRAAGIACIYQHLSTVPNLTASENVFLGQAISRHGRLKRSDMDGRFVEMCAGLGLAIDPRTKAERLSIAEQQVLEILRGLQAGAKILLLDEPTASLPVSERDRLYAIVASLREAGTTIVLVSHKLDEVLTHSQDITVMRNGAVVQTRPASAWTEEELIATMTGVPRTSAPSRRRTTSSRSDATPLLELSDLEIPGTLSVPELCVGSGEVVGVTGLVGSGRSTLLLALAGMVPGCRGHLTMRGAAVPWPTTPRRSLRLGIALVPEDRKSALVMGLPIWDNVALGYGAADAPKWLLTRKSRAAYATRHLDGLDVDVERLSEPVANLSGGNQQKVVIAKWTGRDVTILLADEPTQAIDVSAKQEVLARLRRFADSGKGVLLVSSELSEILAVCDRAVVLWRGEIVDQISRTSSLWNDSDLLRSAFGRVDQGADR